MYQALYRKYRPTYFDEVVGQEIIVNTLKNAIKYNKITHAYLFTGPRGTGKTTIAKILAKTINCENTNDCIPCNKCVSCTQINLKNSTDIIEIDAASNNGVEEIREIRNKVSIVPSNSKYKIYIIDEVHMLTTGAFNALLKTLEEPPKHIIFILATTEPQKIPTTILSRCQRYDFKKISVEKLVERLKYICKNENINISDSALEEIAYISDGGMRDSISILDQLISYKGNDIDIDDVHLLNGTLTQEELSKFFTCLIGNDIKNVLLMIDEYDKTGKNIVKIVEEIILMARNILIQNVIPDYYKENKKNQIIYNNIIENYDIKNITEIISNLNEIVYKMKTSTNSKLVLEIEFIKLLSSKNISQEINIPKFSKKLKNNNLFSSDILKEEVKNQEKSDIESKEINKNQEHIIKDDPKSNNIDNIKNIRINNTLSDINKKIIIKIKECKENLKIYIVDKEYGKFASLLLDGTLKAASTEYLIFVYKSQNDSIFFNNNLLNIEKLIYNITKEKYKVISTTTDDWEIIKNEYNNKKKEYIYIEEPKEEEIIVNRNDDMEDLFGQNVEYIEEEIK